MKKPKYCFECGKLIEGNNYIFFGEYCVCLDCAMQRDEMVKKD